MAIEEKSVHARDTVLEPLDLVVEELFDATADLTNEVIVVVAPHGHLVQNRARAEMPGVRQARFLEQPDGAVDSGQSGPGRAPPDDFDERLQFHVPLAFEERVHDRFADLGIPEILPGDELAPGRLQLREAGARKDRGTLPRAVGRGKGVAHTMMILIFIFAVNPSSETHRVIVALRVGQGI
jgi:hypothetical protein